MPTPDSCFKGKGVDTPLPESALSEPISPGLYIVATPIGNLGDITLRAVDVLKQSDVIACEDTRVTGKLLKHLGIAARMQRYDDHASDRLREQLLDQARSGVVSLVSDAGTPLVSDPGYRLIRAARDTGVDVVTLPGPCAAIAGLTVSGLPNDRFLFAGFLPVKEKARLDTLNEFSRVDSTLIFYETGPRLVRSLDAMSTLWPTREIAVARELTKLHEECRSGTAEELSEYYSAQQAKGEIVLLVGPPDKEAQPHDADSLLKEALEHASPSKAAGMVSKATGIDRQSLYARAVEMKGK